MQRVPSLDGLRAISILLVIASHLVSGTADWKEFATMGVRVFFVISGFLITSLLMEEAAATGSVSLKNFYMRRSLRIFPLAYFYIATVLLLSLVGVIHESRSNLIYAATYTMSYKVQPSGYLAHLWSLSVEEQFYLLWPAMFAVMSIRNAGRLAIAAIIASPFLRAAWWFFLPGHRLSIGYAFPTVIDPLAFGCAAAVFSADIERHIRKVPALVIAGLPILAWVVMATPNHLGPGMIRSGIRFCGDSIVAVLLTGFVAGSVVNPAMRRILDFPALVWIGVMSYSLYVWHLLFAGHVTGIWYGMLRLVSIAACAVAAHYAIEMPFLRLKKRFGTRAVAAIA